MNDLVIENEKLIYYVLKKMHMYHLKDEYYDIGMIGLVKAGKYYKPEYGKFTTYAVHCIANEIKQEIRRNNIPKRKATVISLDTVIYSDDNDITLQDTIVSPDNIEEEIIKREEIQRINKALLKLNIEEKKIIKKYYFEAKTQQEIAEELNIAQATLSRKIQRIINKLKKHVGVAI